MRKLGINIFARKDVPLKEQVALMKDVGFDASFITPADDKTIFEAADHLHSAGLTIDTIHAPWKGINDIWLEGDNGEEPLSAFMHYVDLCKATGVPIAVIHLSSGATPPPVTDVGRERFTRLVDYAGEQGISLAFENQRMLSNLAWVFEEFKDTPHVGFCWDVGHEACFTGGRRYMPLFADKLICTHIHDNDCIYDHDQHRIPFDASIDFDRVSSELRASDFSGTLMLEVAGSSSFYQDISAEEYYKRAYAAACRLRDML